MAGWCCAHPRTRPPLGRPALRELVAIGGGHGTAVALRAARRYAESITAIVSVADDGGSSGRLRDDLDMVALGDMRKCLSALSADSALARAFEHRFAHGELAGHALGNLLLAGLVDSCGDLVGGIDACAQLLGAEGRVLPATTEKVRLRATAKTGPIDGQVAISRAASISTVYFEPRSAATPRDALDRIATATQVLIGPGSLYTSVLAAASIREITTALATTSAQCVYICNLAPQIPETEGYSVADHLDALERHGVRVDLVLVDRGASLAMGDLRVDVVIDAVAGSNGLVHDPGKLAIALEQIASTSTKTTLR